MTPVPLSPQPLLASLDASVITLDLDGYVLAWSRGAARLFGYEAADIIGKHILVVYADEDDHDAELFNTVLTQGSGEMEVKRRRKNGETFWASMHLSLVRDDQGAPLHMMGYVRDITDRLEAEEKNRLFGLVFEQASDAVVIVDLQQRIVRVNHAFQRITGIPTAIARGQQPTFFAALASDTRVYSLMQASLQATGHWEGELWDTRLDGTSYPLALALSSVRNQVGEITHYLAIFSDLTERKAAEKQIHQLAYYDALTTLPNRAMLFSLIEQALAEARRNKQHGALLCFNLSGFKDINDSFGHAIADRLLVDLSARIRECLREEDVVSRFGADEFYIALFDIEQREDAGVVARRVLHALAEPFELALDGQTQSVMLSAHIGISVYPDDAQETERLINEAAVAMYRARQGNHDVLFYSSEMNRRSLERIKLETDLRFALDRREFELHYQPQYDVRTQRIVGAEALIRWRHREKGLISPGLFIPFAEETGLIVQIGDWVLQQGLRQLATWRAQGLHLPRLAINVSGLQLRSGFADSLLAHLAQWQVPPQQLELEMTETILMRDNERMTQMLAALSESGLRFALDDFGTGYSNLSYLQHFQIDLLKIDRTFVQGLPDNSRDVALVRSMVQIAQNLGLGVIAEGVETAAQAEFLTDLGCNLIQGYYYHPALPAEQLTELLIAQQGGDSAAD